MITKGNFCVAAILLCGFCAFAQKENVTEPSDLTGARKAYQAKVRTVLDPITTDYRNQLEGLKKSYGARGQLTEALAIQKEIDSLKETTTTSEKKPEANTKRSVEELVVGVWNAVGSIGGTRPLVIYDDMTCDYLPWFTKYPVVIKNGKMIIEKFVFNVGSGLAKDTINGKKDNETFKLIRVQQPKGGE